MTRYLYVLSIGPIQDFIAAARRTRDLWFGSFLLSEISKAAANKIYESKGTLIFPAPGENCKNLKQPAESIYAFNVSNIILAVIQVEEDPKILSNNAIEAAKTCWKGYAQKVKDQTSSFIITEIWDHQVEDIIECYAAWVPFEKNEDYQKKRNRLMHLLAGRKTTRNFIQSNSQWRVNKSSLDGARESVIDNKKRNDISPILAMQMRLTDGEELCAVGLTKRLGHLGGSRVSFPSLTRVALDPWIRGVYKNPDGEKILNEVETLCKGENGDFPYSFSTGTGKIYPRFNCDGQVLFSSRLESIMPKLKGQNSKEKEILQKIKKCTNILHKSKLQGGFGEPDPYLAILVADGDKMGKVISGKTKYQEHITFSETLSKFAKEAREIIEKKNCGCLVYSGGDDVLAFLPVNTCIKAARELHNFFGELLKDDENNDRDKESPTLSVGIAIGHKQVPLEDLLEYGREAERDSKKPDRNGLAVHLYTRSGGDPIRLREQWDQKEGIDSLDVRLDRWVEMYLNDLFPDKAAYDLKQLAESYKGWEKEDIPEELLVGDINRLLSRKRSDQGKCMLQKDDIDYIVKHAKTYDKLCHLADELILARRIEINDRQTRPEKNEGLQ